MLRFQCPRCRSVLEAPEAKAGIKTSCPKCQQRLQVPLPPPGKTVLAPLVPAPRPEARPGAPPHPKKPASAGPVPRAAAPRAKWPLYLAAAGGAAVALFLATVAGIVILSQQTDQPATAVGSAKPPADPAKAPAETEPTAARSPKPSLPGQPSDLIPQKEQPPPERDPEPPPIPKGPSQPGPKKQAPAPPENPKPPPPEAARGTSDTADPPKKAAPADRAAPRPAYEAVDKWALAASAEDEKTLAALSGYLAKGCKTAREKARAIFRWVTDRITYDTGWLRGGDRYPLVQDPEGVLKKRKTDCVGYADLVVNLAGRMQLKAVRVDGFLKLPSHKPGRRSTTAHSWNAVQADGKWFLMDASNGTGSLRGTDFVKDYNDYFFSIDPEQWILLHFPEAPRWQLLEKPVTIEEFVAWPYISPGLLLLRASGRGIREAIREQGDTVITFASSSTELIDVPLVRALESGRPYRFVVRSTAFDQILLVAADGSREELGKQGDVFSGSVKAAEGTLRLAGRLANQNKVKIILEYMVKTGAGGPQASRPDGTGERQSPSAAPNPKGTAAAPDKADLEKARQTMLDLTNQFRQSEKVPALERDARLTAAAQKRAEDMARQSKEGQLAASKSLRERMEGEGYQAMSASENVSSVKGLSVQEAAVALVGDWKKAPVQRGNLLNPTREHIGIGIARAADGRYFFCLVLAKPLTASAGAKGK